MLIFYLSVLFVHLYTGQVRRRIKFINIITCAKSSVLAKLEDTFTIALFNVNRIGGVMVSVVASSALYRSFDPWSGPTNDYKIGACNFYAKQAALWRKSKDWLARDQDNVS